MNKIPNSIKIFIAARAYIQDKSIKFASTVLAFDGVGYSDSIGILITLRSVSVSASSSGHPTAALMTRIFFWRKTVATVFSTGCFPPWSSKSTLFVSPTCFNWKPPSLSWFQLSLSEALTLVSPFSFWTITLTTSPVVTCSSYAFLRSVDLLDILVLDLWFTSSTYCNE